MIFEIFGKQSYSLSKNNLGSVHVVGLALFLLLSQLRLKNLFGVLVLGAHLVCEGWADP